MTLDLSKIRDQFPALNRPAIFFDNPGGTQIAIQSLNRMNKYLLECNANHEGVFATSRASDAINVTERLGLEDSGGMVRVGAAHYNTPDEIECLGEALKKMAKLKDSLK